MLISGWFGPANVGDDAILLTEISTFLRRIPDLEVSVLSFDWNRTQEMLSGFPRLRRVIRMERGLRFLLSDFGELLRALSESDLLIIGGGGFLQDLYNAHTVPFFWGLARLARSLGKQTVIFASGVGPLRLGLSRLMCKDIADGCALVTVRDQASAEALRSLSVRSFVDVCADVSFLLEDQGGSSGMIPGEEGSASGGRVAVAVQGLLRWPDPSVGALAAVLDEVAAGGREIIFMPFGRYSMGFARGSAGPGTDVKFSERVARRMSRPSITFTDFPGVGQVLDAIRKCDLLISMRFHGIVFAVLAGIPAVAITYGRETKVAELMRDLGEPELVVGAEDMTHESLSRAVGRALETRARERWAASLEQLKKRATRNFELLEEMLSRRARRAAL